MKLSVFLPSIRVHLLPKWYETLQQSCNRHDFEVVVCGPTDPQLPNMKFIQDYGCPTRAAQLAALGCTGDLLYHTVDDVLFYPNVISDEIDKFEDITGMRYREGTGYNGHLLPDDYWYAKVAYEDIQHINNDWGICVHFLMKRLDFLNYGGFDCKFEYLNHATHDLLFRMQSGQHKYKISDNEICSADWQPCTTGDHAPIHFAQESDFNIFKNKWSNIPTSRINLTNWAQCPARWTRRFG